GNPLLDLAEQLQPVHLGHVDVRENGEERRLDFTCEPIQRFRPRSRVMQDIHPLADLMTKPLPKKLSYIEFVIHHQDADTHDAASAAVRRVRGRRIVNSVNSPSRLSTAIVPPCCWVTMSQLIERPRPVPSPVGLVVKNGWNSWSRISGGMPVPLSRTRTSAPL